MNNPLSAGMKQVLKDVLKFTFPYATFKLTLKTGTIHDILVVKVSGDCDLNELETVLENHQTNYLRIALTGKTFRLVA
jgi:hypothetical protein